MRCDRCATTYDPEDNYCRHCGADLRTIEVAAVAHGPSLPAPVPVWRQAAPVVARGAAVVAAGALVNLAAGRLARAAVRVPARMLLRSSGRKEVSPASASRALPKGAELLTEILYIRQIRLRR